MYRDPWQEWEEDEERGGWTSFLDLYRAKGEREKTLAWTRFGGRERDRYGGKERIYISVSRGREEGEGEGHLERRSTVRIVSTHTGASPSPTALIYSYWLE